MNFRKNIYYIIFFSSFLCAQMDIEQKILEHKINIDSEKLTNIKNYGKVVEKFNLHIMFKSCLV